MTNSEALLRGHFLLVRSVAWRIHKKLPLYVDREELVSAGLLGLIEAAAQFNGARHVKFEYYAQFRIRGAILDHLRSLDWHSRSLRRKERVLEEAFRSKTHKAGRTPCEDEVAAELNLPLATYQQLRTELGHTNSEYRHGVQNQEALACLAAPSNEEPLARCLQAEKKQHLIDALELLPERERIIIMLYYYEDLSIKEIAKLLSVTSSRVSQIKTSAVLKVRSSLTALPFRPTQQVKPT